MGLQVTEEWFKRRAALEGDSEIGAGRRFPTVNLTAEDIAACEALLMESLPTWARDRIEKLEAELARHRSDRQWIVGFNDGWEAALSGDTQQ